MEASPPTSRPDPSTAVTRIALQVGATPMAHVDIGTMLAGVCSALPPAIGVAAAVLLLTEPADPRDPGRQQVFASDDAAGRLGTIQHRAGRGPVPAAVRADRPLSVPDLTVSGPPELAAAAADCGLVRSFVVPLPVSGRTAGGLQLLAGAGTELDERTAGVLWPLVSALSARLADARELARLAARVAETDGTAAVGDDDPDVAPETTAVPTVHGTTAMPTVPEPVAEPVTANGHAAPHVETTRLPSVPATVDADPPAATDQNPPTTTERDQVAELFAPGETTDETPPTGQARLGWEGPDHTPRSTVLPTRALPATGRAPRPTPHPVPRPLPVAVPAAVPSQRSGPLPVTTLPGPEPVAAPAAGPEPGVDHGGLDGPTSRVPRHRLRDDD